MTASSQHIQQLFAELADLPAAASAERIQCIEREDPALAARLRELLAADAQIADMPTQPLRELRELDLAAEPEAGTVAGYRLLDRLGAGGMGTVYRAQSLADPALQVAIKFLRAEHDNAALRQRFQLEGRVLQSLQHPGIAHLVESGETSNGTPYVAMELVEGTSLLAYADAQKLDLEQRLGLLLKVCAAVTHAHARRVVHRDIKSSNILVDAKGQPKLLDFGIAKPLHTGFGLQHLERTATAQRFFSVGSAAPEQLSGGASGPGCDIYALGALLYELLCGETPLPLQGLSAGQIEQAILKQTPQLPSLRLAGLSAGVANARARQRGLADRTALIERLRGEADRICAKALRKQSAQRHASVEQFARELRALRAGGSAARPWQDLLLRLQARPAWLGAAALLAALSGLLLWHSLRPQAIPPDTPPLEAAGDPATLAPAQAAVAASVDATTLLALAEADLARGADNDALRRLEQAEAALSADDAPQAAHFRLLLARATAATRSGDFALAGQALEQADALAPDPGQRIALALQRSRLLQARGRPDEAAALLRELAQQTLPQLDAENPHSAKIRQQLQEMDVPAAAATASVPARSTSTTPAGFDAQAVQASLEAVAAQLRQASDESGDEAAQASAASLSRWQTRLATAPAPAQATANASDSAAAQLETLVQRACSLNAQGRYGEAQGVLATALELHRNEPALRHSDTYRVGVLAQAVADHAAARDADSAERLRHELGREAWLSSDAGRARWREQAALARKLGITP